MTDNELKDIREELRRMLDAERFCHCLEVEKTAVRLAGLHGADKRKAAVAGLLHDCAKTMSPSELLKKARKEKIRLDGFTASNPKLLHDKISAVVAEKHFKIRDRDVLSAIAHHTAGREKMTKLEKIIYLADHIEPGRKHAHVTRMRKIAGRDMDRAIALVASEMIQYLLKKGLPIYTQTVVTRNYYLT